MTILHYLNPCNFFLRGHLKDKTYIQIKQSLAKMEQCKTREDIPDETCSVQEQRQALADYVILLLQITDISKITTFSFIIKIHTYFEIVTCFEIIRLKNRCFSNIKVASHF